MESRNETHYSGCREYGAESIRFEIGLKSPIHSETAAAGDAVTGVILRDVKDVARANDIVRGRIPRLEQPTTESSANSRSRRMGHFSGKIHEI